MTARRPKSQEALTRRSSRKQLRRLLLQNRKDTRGQACITQGSCGGREGQEITKEGGGLRRTLGETGGHQKNQEDRQGARGDMGWDMREMWEIGGAWGQGPCEPPRPREALGRQQAEHLRGQSMERAPERGHRPRQVELHPLPRIQSPACPGGDGHSENPPLSPARQLTAQRSSWPPSARWSTMCGQREEAWSHSSGPTARHVEQGWDRERQRQ